MKKVIRFVLDILLIACIVMSVFFGYKVYQRYREDRNNKETYQKIQTYAKKDIDWNKLRKINPDIVGWIKIKDTKINYPVVKGKTNRTYLHTDFNKKYNYMNDGEATKRFVQYLINGNLERSDKNE